MTLFKRNHLFFAISAIFTQIGCSSGAYGAELVSPLTVDKKTSIAPWGVKREVTPSDRSKIAKYRDGNMKPVFETDFTDPADLNTNWNLLADDPYNSQSCRRPDNITTTKNGLVILTKLNNEGKKKWSTGTMTSKFTQSYGFYEAKIRIAEVSGINNAFWLTTQTESKFEIDIAEIHHPGTVCSTVHNWAEGGKSVGYSAKFKQDLSKAYHDYGVLWTPNEIIYEVDGEPIGALKTNGNIKGQVIVRFSTALIKWAGALDPHPEHHDMRVKDLRIYTLK